MLTIRQATETDLAGITEIFNEAIEKTTARTADLSAPDAAFVLWTSGTTGEPKPILHSHDAYLEIIDRVLAPLRAAPSRRSHPRPAPGVR